MELLQVWILPCLYAFLASASFCLIFNIHGVGILICGFGGGLGWLAYLIAACAGCEIILCNFLAAVAITVYAEIMARIRRCPVTSYLLIALLPLVPGAGIYEAMRYCVEGDTELFLEVLLRTFGIAGALAIGTMLASSVLRVLFPIVHHIHR